MKQLFFIVFLLLTVCPAKAQSATRKYKFSYTTTIGSGLAFSTPSSTPFTWQVLGYYSLTDKWAIGAGTGLFFYEKMLIPLYGDVRFQIGRSRRFIPYTELAMGYSMAPGKKVNGGFFMNPSFGFQYPLKNKMKLQLAIGYEIQELERLKTQTDNYFHKEFTEKLSHHSVSLKWGIMF